jgi:hypothetical protein
MEDLLAWWFRDAEHSRTCCAVPANDIVDKLKTEVLQRDEPGARSD